jgi:hypothetical protein
MLKGEGAFKSLYNFIWLIENQPRLYKIENVSLRETKLTAGENTGKSGVLFDMRLRAYYSSVAGLSKTAQTVAGEAFIPNGLPTNPFAPLIQTEVQANTRGLLDVERASLQAVVEGTAYISGDGGKIWVMQEGDEVYLGYLTKVNAQRGEVEFTLNKGGISEKFVLRIEDKKRL